MTLDEKLKFDVHTEQIERKALRSLDLLRRVKETESISTKCMLQLYKALITPQLEYAASVWQVGDCSVLEKVQRKGLAMCLGVPGTAGIVALEVEAGVKPLRVRREELAVRQAARIMMKPDDACLKVSWDSYTDKETTERKVSPFGKMSIQLADMTTNTGISLHGLEKEFTYMYLDSLQPTKRPPEYWQNLGSSKSRSAEQEKLSREVIGGVIEGCDAETAVVFTDGSCLGNPGPCGAGACLSIPGSSDLVMLKQPVSSRGSILLGELVAIKMALQYLYRSKVQRGSRHLFNFRPRVDFKLKNIFESTFGERIISQLRTGYVGLNEYLHKCNVKENDNCECGGIETVGHYLLECPKYENEREILRKRIFDSCGIANFGLNMLLLSLHHPLETTFLHITLF